MANSNSLILTLKTSPEIILVKDTKTQEITVGDNKYEVVLKGLSFMKKMYEPGLITADIQFKLSGGTVWKTISKKDLDTTFKSMEAELAYGKAEKDKDGKWTFPNKTTICSSYYIYQINARYLSDSLFATMVIQSVDKQLTIEEGCYSYVSQRLCRDIIEGRKNEFALPYKTTDHVGYNYDNLKVICTEAAHKEAIFPYLVQYNESYYDFLVRTCNRWGEFLYFEDGKLTIGYDNSKTTDVKSYSCYSFCNLNMSSTTPTAVTNISETATYDEHMLGTKLEKGNYDTLRGVMGCSTENGGDVWAAKIIGNLLSSGKNLFDYIVDTVVDETIARQQAKDKVDNNNDNFAKNYFNPGDKPAPEVLAHYDSAKSQYNEFSDIDPHLKSELYKKVLRAEVEASIDAVTINFDTSYFHLKLGDIITINSNSQKYIVIQVNTNEEEDLVIDFDNKTTKKVSKTTFQVIATKIDPAGSLFYPTLHPAGHIRISGPQHAKVVKESAKDPTRQGRVQVQFPWQKDNTPWLEFARPGGNKGTGTYNHHYKDEEVLVAFVNGNIERPYVMGALATGKQSVPASTYTNEIVHVTPGGQAIKMSDGTGAGFTALLAGLSPTWKIVQGFYPGSSLPGLDFDKSKNFEGSIELADKYGMYSIKGSTDGRNVTIKSPFGDVKLNAFTGITISAPNGDVKIAGKNVTIEAGNNLTLTSGKNIKDGFWASYNNDSYALGNFSATLLAAISKKTAALAGGFIDLTVPRHIIEVFMRPIEGKLQVKSNRYLALEAGNGKTSYPADAFQKSGYTRFGISAIRNKSTAGKQKTQDELIRNQFMKINELANAIKNEYFYTYINTRCTINSLKLMIAENTVGDKKPCKPINDILDTLWDNNNSNVQDVAGFDGILKDVDNDDNLTDEFIKFYLPQYSPERDGRRKKIFVRQFKKRQEEVKKSILQSITQIKLSIFELKNVDIQSIVNARGFDQKAKTALSDKSFKEKWNKIFDDDNFKHFESAWNGDLMDKYKRMLRRKCYIALVNAYGFERAATGGVAGIGAKAPDAPDPFADNIEAAWNTYVNSIQSLPKIKADKNIAADFAQKYLGDPFFKQIGLDLLNDAFDCKAFGVGSKGKILFSSGQGTMMLENDIMRANVDEAEDTDYGARSVTGKVAELRNMMNL